MAKGPSRHGLPPYLANWQWPGKLRATSIVAAEPAWQEFAVAFEYRIGSGGDQMRVDAADVAQQVEVQRAGLGGLAGAHGLEMRRRGGVLQVAEGLLLLDQQAGGAGEVVPNGWTVWRLG
jgi:hypothetical protein